MNLRQRIDAAFDLILRNKPGDALTFLRPYVSDRPDKASKEVSASGVTYRFSGTPLACAEFVDMVERAYAPEGYGTRVASQRKLDGGMLEVTVWRALSCD